MKIVGIQKLTLLDYPGKVACTVFLNGCNFRCPYCHNAELLGDADEVMTVAGLLAFLRKRQGILEGVCITGGEPTLHPELPALLGEVRALGYAVKLDTNGYRPEILEAVLHQGLVDYVAMDLKNGPESYAETVGLAGVELAKIRQSIRLLMDSPVDFELRTTVADPLHSGETITSMANWLLETTNGKPIPRLFVQPFVDRDTVPVGGFSAPTGAELEQFCRILGPCAERVELRGT
jgi:pyruvate formate lyase activating enzyme